MKRLVFVVPLIMSLFFVRNIYFHQIHNMDSWMGGGMRMFGKIDKTLYRVVSLKIISNEGKVTFVNLNNLSEYEKETMSLRVMPTSKKASILKSKIMSNFDEIEEFDMIVKNQIDKVSIVVSKVNYDPKEILIKFEEICNYETKTQ